MPFSVGKVRGRLGGGICGSSLLAYVVISFWVVRSFSGEKNAARRNVLKLFESVSNTLEPLVQINVMEDIMATEIHTGGGIYFRGMWTNFEALFGTTYIFQF